MGVFYHVKENEARITRIYRDVFCFPRSAILFAKSVFYLDLTAATPKPFGTTYVPMSIVTLTSKAIEVALFAGLVNHAKQWLIPRALC